MVDKAEFSDDSPIIGRRLGIGFGAEYAKSQKEISLREHGFLVISSQYCGQKVTEKPGFAEFLRMWALKGGFNDMD